MKRAVLVLLLIFGCSQGVQKEEASVPMVCHGETCFTVELAVTEQQQATGLMWRASLPPEHGMLFIFSEEGHYDFWMMNTLIALDIIWLDSDMQVQQISRNAMPCGSDYCPTIRAPDGSKYVLELNAGTADRIGLGVGARLEFRE